MNRENIFDRLSVKRIFSRTSSKKNTDSKTSAIKITKINKTLKNKIIIYINLEIKI